MDDEILLLMQAITRSLCVLIEGACWLAYMEQSPSQGVTLCISLKSLLISDSDAHLLENGFISHSLILL